ncbi:hypothetical protein Tco_1282798 [Tanacetum coccineum]
MGSFRSSGFNVGVPPYSIFSNNELEFNNPELPLKFKVVIFGSQSCQCCSKTAIHQSLHALGIGDRCSGMECLLLVVVLHLGLNLVVLSHGAFS